MLSSFRDRVGTAGFVVAIIALVAALAGGAYAANGSGSGKATASKVKTKVGPRGPRGPAGPAGPAGAAGPQGLPGANGKDGSNGSNGINGAAGPTGATGPTGAKGSAGSAGAVGETGPTGATGPTGSFGGATPGGQTVTGYWFASGSYQTIEVEKNSAIEMVNVGNHSAYAPISFPQSTAASGVHFRTEANFTDFDESGPEEVGCKGTPTEPSAPPGNLCVYINGGLGGLHGLTFKGLGLPPSFTTPSPIGMALWFEVTAAEAWAGGSWAATAKLPAQS